MCEAPMAGEEITVRPGDAIGYYATHSDPGGARNEGIQLHETLTGEVVRYRESTTLTRGTECTGGWTSTTRTMIISVTLGKRQYLNMWKFGLSSEECWKHQGDCSHFQASIPKSFEVRAKLSTVNSL